MTTSRGHTSPGSTLFGRNPASLGGWVGHPEQVTGLELCQLLEADAGGVRMLRMRGGEVEVDVLVDRALDPLRARVRGVLAPSAVVAARVGAPRATSGAAQDRDWRSPGPPDPGAGEAVWEHEVIPDADGWGRAAVLNDDVGDARPAGLLVAWEVAGLPRLAQWTMPGAGMYVVGLEPSTVGIGGVAAAAADGSLVQLAAGASASLAVDLTFLHGAEDLDRARSLVDLEER